jgi:hypothetical protein
MTESQDRAVDEDVREDARRERATDEGRATPVRGGGSSPHHDETTDALRPDEPEPVPPEDPRADRDPDDEADPIEGRPS